MHRFGGAVRDRFRAAAAPEARCAGDPEHALDDGKARQLHGNQLWGGITVYHQRAYLSTPQAAAILGLSRRTLERYRVTGEGPVFAKIGRRVCYARVARRRKRSTSDEGR